MNRQWKAGIEPQNLTRIVDELYVSEQIGGYDEEYRPVRRDVEITWLVNQEFDYIVSLLPTTQNLQNYSKNNLNYIHHPIPNSVDGPTLVELYEILQEKMAGKKKILIHRYRRTDFMTGIVAGFYLYTKLAQNEAEAILQAENHFSNRINEQGRNIVNLISASLVSKSKS